MLKAIWEYKALIIVICVILLASVSLQSTSDSGSLYGWMHDFMGLFLVVFAMFKLMNVSGFAEGFQMYDLIAKRWHIHGYIYPLLELSLGLAFLGRLFPAFTYTATAFLMIIGATGVILALRKGMDVRCACLGTFLKVPLSTVTVAEDLLMALMALVMLF